MFNQPSKNFKKIQAAVFALAVCLLCETSICAATRTWDGGGATNTFSEAANWSGDVAPTSGDDLIFNTTSQKNATIDQTVSARIFRISGYNGTITQAGAVNVSVVTFELTTGTYVGSDGSFTITPSTGSSAVSGGGTFVGGTGLFTFNNGDASAVFNVAGSFSLGGDAIIRNLRISSGGTFNASSGTLNVRGNLAAFDFQSGGTFNHNNGTVKTAGQINGGATLQFFNLQIADNTSVNGAPSVNGTLTLETGKSLNGGSLNINGDVIFQPVTSISTTQLIFGGTTPRTATLVAALNATQFNLPIVINNPNLILTTNGATGGTIDFRQKVTVQNGKLQQGAETYNFSCGSSLCESGLLISGGTFQGGAAPVSLDTTTEMTGGNFNVGTGGLFATNKVYKQTGGVFNCGAGDLRFYDVRATGGTFNAPPGTLSIASYGSFSNPTFNNNGGTLKILNNVGIIAPNVNFNNIALEGTGNHGFSGTPKPRVNGTLNLTEGTLSGEVAANGDLIYGANFMGGSGRLFFEGTAMRTINLPARTNLLGITLDNPNVTVTTSDQGVSAFTGVIEVKRGLLQQGSQVLTLNTTLNVTGGTFQGSAAALTNNGTYININISGGAFNSGAGAISVGTINTSGGTFNGGSGNIEIARYEQSGGTFNAPSGMMTVIADWTHPATGTFNAGSGTVKFTGFTTPVNCGANGVSINVPTTETFYNLDIANTFCSPRNISAGDTLIVTNDLRLTAAAIGGGRIRPLGTTTIEASNQGYVGSTIVEYVAPNRAFVINHPSQATRTLPIEMNAANSTLTGSGTGRLNVYALDLLDGTVNQGASVWDITNAGLQQNFGFYRQSGGTFNGNTSELFVNPTITGGTFNGGTGKITGSGFRQTGGAFSTAGDMDTSIFTLEGGTFNAPLGTMKFTGGNGNCYFTHTATSGTFNARTGTVEIQQGICTFDVKERETFNNLVFRGSSIIAANDTLVVGGNTVFNSGFANGGSIEANGDVQHLNGGSGNFNGNPNNGTTVLKFVDTATRTINFNTANAGYSVINTLVDNPNITINLGTSENATAGFYNGLTLRAGTINQGAGQAPMSVFNQSGGTFNGGTYSVATNLNSIGNFTLSGGTFNAAPTTTFAGNYTHTAGGAFNHPIGTIYFSSTFNGANGIVDVNQTETFNSVNFRSGNGTNIAAGDTVIIKGLTTLQAGTINGGTLELKGDLFVTPVNSGGNFSGGTANLTFSGTADQTYTNQDRFTAPGGTWTVNKGATPIAAKDWNENKESAENADSRQMAPASSLLLNGAVGNPVEGTNRPLSYPIFNIAAGNVRQLGNFSHALSRLTVAAGSVFTNFFGGGIQLSGDVTNDGFINFNANGAGCQTDGLIIRSSVMNTQRNWNGTGIFRIVDTDLRDQAGTALITTNSSTNSGNMGANWTFDSSCSVATAAEVSVSGRAVDMRGRGIGRVRIELVGADGIVRATSTNSFGFYSFEQVQAGGTYILNARHKARTFTAPTIALTVKDETENVDFTAN